MSRLPDHVIMCHIMLGSCHMLPRCALAGKLVFFCKTWNPWGQQTERKKDESADESSLDPCALLKGTSAALVDTGDRVWLIYIWNTLSSFPGTIRLTFLRFVQKCLCFCICACMCVFVCVCVCVLPWGAVCVVLAHSRPVLKCSRRCSATPPEPSDLKQASATWRCNPANALMWTRAHTQGTDTHTHFQSKGGTKWLNIQAITSRSPLLTLAGPGTACSACPSWCWGGWRTLGSSGPPEAGPQTPSPPCGPALPPPDPAACRCSPSPPVCCGGGGGHIEGMCIIYFYNIYMLTQRYTAVTNFTAWNNC